MRNFNVSDLTKGCNDLLILAILQNGVKHGYQIATEMEERSEGYFTITYGSLYPALHRLEKKGLIKGEWQSEESLRKKKVYKITSAGRREIRIQRDDWLKLYMKLFNFLEE